MPTICKNVPTEPEIALNILLIDKIINAIAANLNSSPNALNIDLGKHKNNIITGKVTQNMVLVDCCTIFFRASISPEE